MDVGHRLPSLTALLPIRVVHFFISVRGRWCSLPGGSRATDPSLRNAQSIMTAFTLKYTDSWSQGLGLGEPERCF